MPGPEPQPARQRLAAPDPGHRKRRPPRLRRAPAARAPSRFPSVPTSRRPRNILMRSPDRTADARPAVAADYDALVLGAGISGLVSASVLVGQGCSRVLVVDSYDHVGGNHIDRAIGPYTFDVGSFIFQDDSPLLHHFPELLDHYVPILPSWGRLNPQGVVTAYPISIRDDILAAGPVGIARIFGSVAFARLFQRNVANARDFARFWIGDHLLRRSGLEAYMERFYGLPPDQIDIELAQKRMGWISEHARLSNLARRLVPRGAPGPTNRQMARPRAGFAALYAPARQRLEARGVTFQLGADLQTLARTESGFALRIGGRTITASRAISTIPVDHASALAGLPSAEPLRTIRLISLFFSFAGRRGFDQSVLYNFAHDGAWKRITVYSDFYGKAADREYFTVEVIGGPSIASIDEAEADFRRHVAANRLFDGDLTLEGGSVLDNAYPIYSRGAQATADAAIAALRAMGVESFGRQGAFDYQPTARVTTLQAEASLGARPPRG
jgi:protoporphyrinogen oxidase